MIGSVTVSGSGVQASNANITNLTAGTVTAARITVTTVNVSNLTAGNLSVTGAANFGGGVNINAGGLNVAAGQTVNFGGNRLQGVGNGVVATDAVNLGQLQSVQKELNKSIASAAAMANISAPSDLKPGEFALGVGIGTSGGQASAAIGISGVAQPGLSYRASVGLNGSKPTFGAGMNWTFK